VGIQYSTVTFSRLRVFSIFYIFSESSELRSCLLNSQAKYWLLTIPHANFLPFKPPTVQYIKGQLESGIQTGYLHWQVLVCFQRKIRRRGVVAIFGSTCHAEPSNSPAANNYVWKDDTAIANTRFELGSLPIQRASSQDWDRIRQLAQRSDFQDIPSDIYVRNYNSLRRISADNLQPLGVVKRVKCFWGPPGTGKSRAAWDQATFDAYPKDPRTKFWDGYTGQDRVVLDEFRGGIDISHILRWLDRYPVLVEVKGSAVVLKASQIWITSNLHPKDWYPQLDQDTVAALLRRLEIVYFPFPIHPINTPSP